VKGMSKDDETTGNYLDLNPTDSGRLGYGDAAYRKPHTRHKVTRRKDQGHYKNSRVLRWNPRTNVPRLTGGCHFRSTAESRNKATSENNRCRKTGAIRQRYSEEPEGPERHRDREPTLIDRRNTVNELSKNKGRNWVQGEILLRRTWQRSSSGGVWGGWGGGKSLQKEELVRSFP